MGIAECRVAAGWGAVTQVSRACVAHCVEQMPLLLSKVLWQGCTGRAHIHAGCHAAISAAHCRVRMQARAARTTAHRLCPHMLGLTARPPSL